MNKPTKQTNNSRKLNSKQIVRLKLIFKFRFVTAELLAKHQQLSRETINGSLKVLLESGYIARFYDKSYKIKGKPAVYYLSTKGIRYFRQNTDFSKRAIHAMYKNPNVSEAFVQHNLDIFNIYISLRSIYPNVYQLFTRSECLSDEYLTELNPDLYLSRKRISKSKYNYLTLFYLSNTQYFLVKRFINQYIRHFGTLNSSEEPSIATLIVCNERVETKLIKYIGNRLRYYYVDEQDYPFLTATKAAIISGNNQTKSIWKNVIEPNKLVAI